MISVFDTLENLNIKEIFDSIIRGEEIILKTYSYVDNYEYALERIFEKILAKYRLEILKNPLSFCIRELTGNARKAIIKRIFFSEKKLDINSRQDYEKGMKLFHKNIYNNIEAYTKKMKPEGFFITVSFFHSAEQIRIKIESNTSLTSEEKIRINSKLSQIKGSLDLAKNIDNIIDNTEGAGLGLIMLVMMLKKEGISPKSFSIFQDKEKTVSEISFNQDEMVETPFSIIAKALIGEVDKLPQFPDNVNKILSLINEEDTTIITIAKAIIQDPSMTADLLKLANSAFFMVPRKVKSIEEALKIIGLKGVKNLIYSYATIKTMSSRYGKLEKIWAHSNKVSYYSTQLAKYIKAKNIVEDAAIAGLLHDLGKIIIMAIEPERVKEITKIMESKNIQEHLVEELIVGINHAKLGSMVAEHWNFPDHLSRAIEYHHVPGFANANLEALVNCTYLANSFAEIELGMMNIRTVSKETLAFFNIKNDDELKNLHNKLKINFEQRIKQNKD